MEDALKMGDGQERYQVALDVYAKCRAARTDERVETIVHPDLVDALGYDFDSAIVEGLGLNARGIDDRIVRKLAGAAPMTQEAGIATIRAVDELFQNYAVEMRFGAEETQETCASEVALWAMTRKLLWEQVCMMPKSSEQQAAANKWHVEATRSDEIPSPRRFGFDRRPRG